MDAVRFDGLARSLTRSASRRGLFSGLRYGLLAVPPLALAGTAAKKRRRRKKRRNGGKCGACPAGQQCQGGTCRCVPESRATTCGGRCGDRINNCGETVGCPACSGERVCLSNGSCAWPCTPDGCPAGCVCGLPSAEGPSRCIANASAVGKACASTAECPHGQHCQSIMPGGQACLGLC